MRLIINTASTHKGGGTQNARSFIEECKNIPGDEYHVIYGPSLYDKIDTTSYPDNFYFYKIDFRPATKVLSLNSQSEFFEELEKEIRPDAVFTTSGPAYWRPVAPHLVGYNLPHHIYPESPFFDLIPLKKKIRWRTKKAISKYYFKRDSEYYVTQTEDVSLRLRKWLKKSNVFTVMNTCSNYYFNFKNYKNKLPDRNPGEFRLLFFSAYYYHKNFEIIPRIIDVLPQEIRSTVKFVLTLEEEYYNTVFPEKYKKFIHYTGPVNFEEGPALYKECDAMFLPTLLECFSASYPEAMVMEKPIITTDLGFARSVCGDAAIYFSSCDPTDASEKITALVNDQELRNKLVNNGKERLKMFLKPDERAREYLRILKSIIKQ